MKFSELRTGIVYAGPMSRPAAIISLDKYAKSTSKFSNRFHPYSPGPDKSFGVLAISALGGNATDDELVAKAAELRDSHFFEPTVIDGGRFQVIFATARQFESTYDEYRARAAAERAKFEQREREATEQRAHVQQRFAHAKSLLPAGITVSLCNDGTVRLSVEDLITALERGR